VTPTVDDALERLNDVLRPTKPIDREALLAGRTLQLQELTDAIRMPGAHALVYGDRGVGKTSLAATAQSLRPQTSVAVRVNCAPDTDWQSLWRSVADEITDNYLTGPTATALGESLDGISQGVRVLSGGVLGVAEALTPLRRIGQNAEAVIVIDEFDKIIDDAIKESVANLIKGMSDKAVPATLVVVGVAETADELFQEHESIKRSLKQIRMPRLSPIELRDILRIAEKELRIRCTDEVTERITLLSRGLPYFTHLVAWHCFDHAIINHDSRVDLPDLQQAQRRAAQTMQEDLGRQVDRAVHSPYPGNKYWDVCVAAASSKTDRSGYFQMRDLRPVLEARTQRSYANFAFKKHLDEFTDQRGPLLESEQRGRGSTVYRFLDPLMAPYILIREAARGPLPDLLYEQLAIPGT
jgi:Cdc6-like AAA superfamily ATPase